MSGSADRVYSSENWSVFYNVKIKRGFAKLESFQFSVERCEAKAGSATCFWEQMVFVFVRSDLWLEQNTSRTSPLNSRLQHDNIVALIGVCKKPFYLVLELMTSDLRSYLRNSRSQQRRHSRRNGQVSVESLSPFCVYTFVYERPLLVRTSGSFDMSTTSLTSMTSMTFSWTPL